MAFLDETGLAELWSLIKAEDAKLTKMAVGTYAGTIPVNGNGGSFSKTITVGFKPQFAMIMGCNYVKYQNGSTWLANWARTTFMEGDTNARGEYKQSGDTWNTQDFPAFEFTDTGLTFSQQVMPDMGFGATYMLPNINNQSYVYIILG